MRNPDEGRYAEIARGMVLRQDWVEPRLFGVDYLSKPVLFYWLLMISFKVFGFTEFAARFMPALFGLLGVIATFIFAKRFYGERAAVFSTLILATNYWYLQVGRYVLIDMVLSFFLVAALYCFYAALQIPSKRTVYLTAFYVLTGLAFLTKGLVALVLPGFTLFVYAFWTKNARIILLKKHWFFGALIVLAVALPWFWKISVAEPEFLNQFFWHEHFNRFVSSDFEHQSPWYYLILMTPVLFLPWPILPEPFFSKNVFKEKFLLAGILCPIIFYSISKTKLPTYILPAFPFLAMWVGRAWADWTQGAKSSVKISSFILAVLCLAGLVTAIGAPSVGPKLVKKFPMEAAEDIQEMGWMLTVGAGAAFWALKKNRRTLVFAALVATLAFSTVPVMEMIQKKNSLYTTEHFAKYLKPQLKQGDLVLLYGSPGAFYDFQFYLDHPVQVMSLEGELELANDNPFEDLIEKEQVKSTALKYLIKNKTPFYCLMRRSDFEGFDEETRKNLSALKEDPRKILVQSRTP